MWNVFDQPKSDEPITHFLNERKTYKEKEIN